MMCLCTLAFVVLTSCILFATLLEILGTRRLDSGSVPLRDSQTHQTASRKGALFILFQQHPSKRCTHVDSLRRTKG